MSIPDYQTIMKPLLKYLDKNRGPNRMQEVFEAMSDYFDLSHEERQELLPSGQQPIINNRVGWARTYLKQAGLLEDPKRGYTQISERGIQVLKSNTEEINNNYLEQFEEFLDFRNKRGRKTKNGAELVKDETSRLSPVEMVENGISWINEDLKEELLGKIERNTPSFFEHLVLDLLNSMGYGSGEVTGRIGDGGIDGFISQDALGIEKIYFQAKRFTGDTNRVSASMVRDFVGSLEIRGVNKGVFITTSYFPRDTKAVLSGTQKRVVLINKDDLLSLMIAYNIGVSIEKTYSIKKVDSDYFPED